MLVEEKASLELLSCTDTIASTLGNHEPSPASGARSDSGVAASLAVIVPATDLPATLESCLPVIRACLEPGDELFVVTEPERFGPAAARNAGAQMASRDILVFVDADVVVHPDALTRIRAAFGADPGLNAVFGSYDDGPFSPGLIAQFRNLLHHHIHQRHPGVAVTFWSGLGAIRRSDFMLAGGFDSDRFAKPSVEDIDLGMRVLANGGRIELHPEVQGTHLKHWTLANMIRTDFHRRGVPWVRMCLERRSLPGTLNVSWREQASTVATLMAVVGAIAKRPRVARRGLAGVLALNLPFYGLLLRRMGVRGALISVGLHAVHRLIGVAAVPRGVAMHVRKGRGECL